MKRIRLYTQRYDDKFIFADGDFTAVAAAIVIRPDGGGAFVLRDEVVGVATQVVRAIATGDIGWPAAPTRQHSRVRGLDPGCATECSVVRQPLRVLQTQESASARDRRGALERHLEGPGMDEFAVGEFVHLQTGNIGRHKLPRMSHDPYPRDGSPRASGLVSARMSEAAKPGSPSTPKRRPESPERFGRAGFKSWMERSRVSIQANVGGTFAIERHLRSGQSCTPRHTRKETTCAESAPAFFSLRPAA